MNLFDEVIKAFRERKGIQEAFIKAAEIPGETAQHCITLISYIREVAEKGNKNSITDAGVAALMAHTAFQSALLNVKINLKEINDDAYVKKMEVMVKELKTNFKSSFDDIMKTVERWL